MAWRVNHCNTCDGSHPNSFCMECMQPRFASTLRAAERPLKCSHCARITRHAVIKVAGRPADAHDYGEARS